MTFSKKRKKIQYTERKNQSANEPLALQWRQQHLPPHSHNRTHTHKQTSHFSRHANMCNGRACLYA